ncbi:Protein of unknown function [Gryllus bimaculatus]|nr:Protein of unknown function [Gryllus bimaculatus]
MPVAERNELMNYNSLMRLQMIKKPDDNIECFFLTSHTQCRNDSICRATRVTLSLGQSHFDQKRDLSRSQEKVFININF